MRLHSIVGLRSGFDEDFLILAFHDNCSLLVIRALPILWQCSTFICSAVDQLIIRLHNDFESISSYKELLKFEKLLG